MNNVRQLTTGALLLAIYAALLLLTTYMPLLGMVTNLFLGLPFILFAYKNDRKSMLVFFVASILLSLIVGTVFAIPVAITFGLTGLVMGDFIREKKSREAIYFGGSIAFLLTVVLTYAISVAFFQIDFIDETIAATKASIESSLSIMDSLGQTPNEKQMEELLAGIDAGRYLKPTLFVMAAFLAVFFIQLVSFPIAKRFQVEISTWKPFRYLQLPKSILWIYLFSIIASMIFNPEEGSFAFMAIVNIAFLLQWLMVLQGLAFIYYFSHVKKFPRAVPIMFTIGVLLFPQLLYIVRILGIIDLGFDLRKRFKNQ
ncbi:YybS family protein [Bacillus coreaensis]